MIHQDLAQICIQSLRQAPRFWFHSLRTFSWIFVKVIRTILSIRNIRESLFRDYSRSPAWINRYCRWNVVKVVHKKDTLEGGIRSDWPNSPPQSLSLFSQSIWRRNPRSSTETRVFMSLEIQPLLIEWFIWPGSSPEAQGAQYDIFLSP